MKTEPVLVTGATGYVGARLVYRLLDAGYRVRATSRSFEKLKSRAWATHSNIELVYSDLLNVASIKRALNGCKVAYYFVHSMNSSSDDFAASDRMAAENMAAAAGEMGLERIIYLGGLGLKNPRYSAHLQSREEVAEILKTGRVPVTHLRAAMIIGSGSASFEMLRYLVDRLPVMITSRRVFTPSQPIAIRNVLVYLLECLKKKETIGKTYDIGGPEALSYLDLIHIYAEEAGLRRRIVLPFSFMTPRIVSYMVHLVTPIPAYIARPLSEGLGCELVVQEHAIRSVIPQKLLTAREAIQMAMERLDQQVIKSSWMDAGSFSKPEWTRYHDAPFAGGTIRDAWYKVTLEGTPQEVWDRLCRIGGDNGWYFGNWLWGLRGFIDRIVGGPGTRRGRRHPTDLRTGDALDWWRVLDARPGERLLLLAEMKAPGEATLEFRISQKKEGVTELVEIASFKPRGLTGLLYWWSVSPFHFFIFRGMLREIARTAGIPIVEGPVAVSLPRHKRRDIPFSQDV